VDALLALAAALLALRLGGGLAKRWRASRRPELALWSASLFAYALAAAALAWGASAGWDGRAFRAYYLFGGLLTAPLLGAGSLRLAGRRVALPLALLYTGLAVGIAIAVPVHGAFAGTAIPAAQDHLAFLPARLVAVLANSLGALAAVGIALATIRHRPLANALIVAGVAVAAAGSALGALGAAGGALSIGIGALLLYAGFVAPARPTALRTRSANSSTSSSDVSNAVIQRTIDRSSSQR
jgi:hypothetical protein